jgi:hypothetical protein
MKVEEHGIESMSFIRLRRRPWACSSEAEIPPVSAGPMDECANA